MSRIAFTVPIRTKSAANLREHHMARHRRVKSERGATGRRWPGWAFGPLLVVRLTRLSRGRLDDDNLRGALKGVRDEVAAKLRLDDASPLVRWEYHQVKGEPAVRVEVLSPGEAAEAAQALQSFAELGERIREVNARARKPPADIAQLATPNTINYRSKP